MSSVKRGVLANCGLLIASLKQGETVIADVNMVVQVLESEGKLIRLVYNPLE